MILSPFLREFMKGMQESLFMLRCNIILPHKSDRMFSMTVTQILKRQQVA